MRLVETLRADFTRAASGMDKVTLTVIRLHAATKDRSVPLKAMSYLLYLVWLRLIIGAEFPAAVQCGPGLRLPHAGRMVIINPQCTIGARATIYHGVTLGGSGDDPTTVPHLGDDVYVGSGASIIGGVRVGHRAKIGAGAVVVKDVPDDATVVGVPARQIVSQSRTSPA